MPASAAAVAESPGFAGPKFLGIVGSVGRVGRAGAHALLTSPYLAGVERLELTSLDSVPEHLHAALAERYGKVYRRRKASEIG